MTVGSTIWRRRRKAATVGGDWNHLEEIAALTLTIASTPPPASGPTFEPFAPGSSRSRSLRA
jgi:hypothetical protein